MYISIIACICMYIYISKCVCMCLYSCVCMYVCMYVLTQPLRYGWDVTQCQFLKESKAGLNSEFSFS